jgi:GNAT superfamily N-acetyltransferase
MRARRPSEPTPPPAAAGATVRPAGPGDVDAICRICSAGFRAGASGLLPDGIVEANIAAHFSPVRVAADIAGVPPGWLGYQVATSGDAGELFVLYLDLGRRREELGTALLSAVADQVRALDATELWASVTSGNTLAIPFYEARGFDAAGEEPVDLSAPAAGMRNARYRRDLGARARQPG